MKSCASLQPSAALSGNAQGVSLNDSNRESMGPLLLLDTAGCDMDEQAEEGSGSKFNDGEAEVCLWT